MIPSHWLTPARAIGLAAYGGALICCAIAWLRARRTPAASALPASLTLIEALLLIDIIVDGRWRLHQFLIAAVQRRHEYDLRSLPQSIATAALIALFLVALLCTLRIYRERLGALLAISGVLLSLVSWCVEVVSLHAVDTVLYRPLGGIMPITYIWILACSMTAIGILIDARRPTLTQTAEPVCCARKTPPNP